MASTIVIYIKLFRTLNRFGCIPKKFAFMNKSNRSSV